MNVIVSNNQENILNNLKVDVIKSINGEHTARDIVNTFDNFFFSKMFLDITAIEDYHDLSVIKTIAVGLDVSKIIFLLPSGDEDINNSKYISGLISMGIYNFAFNFDELMYLYENPNSYKDVEHLQKEKIIIEEKEEIKGVSVGTKVIAFKNLTSHAGATSLIYMFKKILSEIYDVICIEVEKSDFMFFNDKSMVSVRKKEFRSLVDKYSNHKVILIDANNLDSGSLYEVNADIIYLFESSTLMLNKLIMLDNKAFLKIKDKKIILNKSLLSSSDIKRLEFEAETKFYAVIPPLNDRLDNSDVLLPILENLELVES